MMRSPRSLTSAQPLPRASPWDARWSGWRRRWPVADDSPLIDIASAVAEGSAIDWDKAEQTARDGSERAIVRELQVLSKMAEVARAPHAIPPIAAPNSAEALQVGELWG